MQNKIIKEGERPGHEQGKLYTIERVRRYTLTIRANSKKDAWEKADDPSHIVDDELHTCYNIKSSIEAVD